MTPQAWQQGKTTRRKTVLTMTSRAADSTPIPARRSWLDALVAVLFLLSITQGWLMLAEGRVHGNDFKHLWAGAWLLAHDQSPYDSYMIFRVARDFRLGGINPYVYLPSTGLMLRPLAAMSYPAAQVTWFALNWLLAWGIVLTAPRLLRLPRCDLARLAGAAFLVGGFPFYRQMTAGQMNVVTAAILVGTLACLLRRRDRLAGTLLALGFAWKISPALLIVALLPLRRWRAAAWGIAMSAVFMAIALLATGWAVHCEALPILARMGYGQSTWTALGMDFYRDPANQSINSLFHHLLSVNPHTQPWLALGAGWANGLTWLASLTIMGLWVSRLARLKPGDLTDDTSLGGLFLSGVLVMLLLPSLMWDHYAVQALPVLLWVFGQPKITPRIGSVIVAMAIFTLLAVPWLYDALGRRSGPGILLMSIRLWPILALYGWLLWSVKPKGLEPCQRLGRPRK